MARPVIVGCAKYGPKRTAKALVFSERDATETRVRSALGHGFFQPMMSRSNIASDAVPPGWMRRLRKAQIVAVLVFAAVVGLAYSPGVLIVHGIHGDYEILHFYKGSGFFHPEAGHLLSIGRPVAALLSNVTIWPIQSLADLRWTRIFAILTICVAGAQMMSNCIHRIRMTTPEAIAVALATFLILPFIYSISNPSAWAPHLLTTVIAFAAYTILGRSNLQMLPFLFSQGRRDLPALCRQTVAYAGSRSVWLACLVYQAALYDYPPSALILVLFPVIVVLFSRLPANFRTLLAFRDLVFVGVNLALYAVVTKLIYLPISGLFYKKVESSEDPFINRLIAIYQFKLTTEPSEILARVGRLLRVTGDLWFLPQLQIHILVGAVVLLGIIGANAVKLIAPRMSFVTWFNSSIMRVRFDSWMSNGGVTAFVVGSCFLVSAAAVLTAAGGFVAYRTIVVSIALAAIVFLYATRVMTEVASAAIGSSYATAARRADWMMAIVVVAALAGSFYANYATMKLARNEFDYFTGIVKEAIRADAKTIFFLDSRLLTLPEDNPVMYDQKGKAIPPYELGCLSAHCLQSGAIMHIAAAELGRPSGEMSILVPRGDYPVPGLTCSMLTSATPSYPPGASDKVIATIKYYRTFPRIFCATYSPAWQDLDAHFAN